jgi:hypothetical protein
LADAPKTEISKNESITIGNFIIPPMSGWEMSVENNRSASPISLTYTKYLDNDADVEFEFHYEPTKEGGNPPTVSDIKKRALVMLQGVLRANNYMDMPRVTTVSPRLTKFQHYPAYFVSTHMDYSKDPKIIDTDDSKIMIFADKTDMYNMVVDFSNAANTPQSRQLADQVWKKMLKEIKPVHD